MKKLATIILVSVTVLAAVANLGYAASDSATVKVSWTVNPQQSLKISSNYSTGNSDTVESDFNIPTPSNQELEGGHTIVKQDAVDLVATSNIDWEVQVKAKNSGLSTGEDGYTLAVRGMGTFKQVTTNSAAIASGEPGKHEFGVDYKVNYSEDFDTTENYVAELVYTITTA